MSGGPVDPADVPVYTGNLDVLEAKAKALSRGGSKVQTAGSDVHKSFGGLAAFYKAPEAEQLFGVTKPVERTAHELSDDMHVIAKALGTYAREIRPLIHQLKQLKQEAADFRDNEAAEDDWSEDGDLVDENLGRRNKIAEVWAAFQEAERDCHAKIVALVGGHALHTIDASHKNGYGYDAEALKASKSLPWGEAVEESIPAWQVWEHAYEFGKGFIVDGVGGTIDGLYTLFGGHGGDAAGEAWKGLAKLSTAFTITAMPIVGQTYWMLPGKMLPSWLRDSRTAVLDTGKALVAWDQWESNGSRAAGAVTFNVVTAVFTRGGGAAVEGAGKAGAMAKGLSVVSKVGSAVDPMTYVIKGAGAGLSKVGDVMAHLKDLGHVEVPKISEGAYSLPEGAVKNPDGTIQLPKGAAIPEGATKLQDGSIELPKGTVTFPPGTVKDPFTGKYMDPRTDLYNEDGSLFQRAEDAHKEKSAASAADADNPRIETPVREEQRVPAGVGGRGDDTIRVGSEISDPVRAADDLPPGRSDTTPDTTAGHAPSGHAGDHMPTNNLDNGAGGTSRTGDNNPTGGAGHTDTPSTGGGHDVPGGSTTDNAIPGGSSTDNGIPGGGHPDTPSTGAGHPGSDDAARGADDAAHRAEYEAAREKPASERTPTERMAVTREHVRLANEDPVWRAEHYDKWGPGKRNNAEEMVDGQLLPKLNEKPDGSWMAADEMPYANPKQFHLTPLERGRHTVAPGELNHLDDVSAKRFAGMELKQAEGTFKDHPTDETAQALADAQKHYDQTVGADVSNNTKLGEALGEEAARRHMLLQKEFEGAKEVDDPPLPETPNGSKKFDQLWRDKDGNLIIVEAKGPNGTLDWRQGNGELDANTKVQQGTIEYVRTVVADMKERAFTSPGDAKYAAEIEDAILNKTLRYVLVQATENTGKYAGAELKHFKLF
ncbi:hypothetical protein SLV14_003543 [Streptomyces sp. Je 1-4]|uniref:hypothetical protein n=1 Tax=Streptomyces TaxID=1883 RepID=UPI0021D890FC|nr:MULTISPECIES: hypothetical protein [unclassified Streptomyces]UYB40867.1 hypothetical protein SLV14_003543 [Streptomyces sp. Je 1-4]UZQ37025.1 hypothetical protein SLV14N_003543 [Streptomyces sp. Je 1-4] [Streptomyces sp. Je 1-4 4N24]UZQ44442.1 hypothetical protein SLV14NA_003543 [Streptomyces sp. Je 1-4] [Streptomyces sp. Je 1-4 4N24_ara]